MGGNGSIPDALAAAQQFMPLVPRFYFSPKQVFVLQPSKVISQQISRSTVKSLQSHLKRRLNPTLQAITLLRAVHWQQSASQARSPCQGVAVLSFVILGGCSHRPHCCCCSGSGAHRGGRLGAPKRDLEGFTAVVSAMLVARLCPSPHRHTPTN